MSGQYQTILYDEDKTCDLEKSLKNTPGSVDLTIFSAHSQEELRKVVATGKPDLVVLHLKMPSTTEVVKQLHQLNPNLHIIFLTAKPDWVQLDPLVDFVKTPADPGEIKHRIARLLPDLWRQDRLITKPLSRLTTNYSVEKLHSNNGKLDARKVAVMFGFSLRSLAKAIGKEPQAVHKTPDAMSLQTRLAEFERLAYALLKITGSEKDLRIWLNSPNFALDSNRPIDVIQNGHVELIADLAEDRFLGHPM
jgi:response regulator RpfG family c-di-GMP phosphodiesterase